jgi:hypothetical protein
MLERAPILQARMEAARARGYRSGINILATLGHHEENLPNSLSGDYTPMTDPWGKVCRGTFCPNDPNLREYLRQVYSAMAKAKPDYLWIDDDVRLWGHAPIGPGCFCDRCMKLFSQRSGREFTRESLVAAVGTGPREEKLKLRRAFLQHNRDTIGDLFRFLEGVVHGEAPGLPLGFMTGERYFEGYGFDAWARDLAGPNGSEVLWRPGGGNYKDERLTETTDKAHDIGRQVAALPESVLCIESEVESFPYQRLKKSANATALEAAAYIASGCTGTAFNVLSMYDESLAEYEPLVARLQEARPFLDRLARAQGRVPAVGIHCGWVKDSYVADGADGEWFMGPGVPAHCREIWSTGLPASYRADRAAVTAISGDQVLSMSEAEVRAALKSGVYMDAFALSRLNELGYGALTGFELAEVRGIDCIEELTDHPLNGAFAGRRRNGRQSFWGYPAHLFNPKGEGAKAISRYVDYTYRETGPCSFGIFENAEGGRVCVAGYYPWDQLQNLSKSSQLKSVMRWLSKDTLPAYVASFHRMNLWVRETGPATKVVALLNAYLDPAQGVELMVKTENETLRAVDMRCNETTVKAEGGDGPYKRFVLPVVAPWEMLLLMV